MAEPEAMKPAADRRAMNRDSVTLLQFQPQFVQRQIALFGQSPADPVLEATQFADPTQIALTFRRKRTRFAPKLDHVIDELR